jgi:hypothetical protein
MKKISIKIRNSKPTYYLEYRHFNEPSRRSLVAIPRLAYERVKANR